MLGFEHLTYYSFFAWIAQGESVSFTPRGSAVRNRVQVPEFWLEVYLRKSRINNCEETKMDLTCYRNIDGTYTSPKNGKIFKSEKALRAHLSFKKTKNFFNFERLKDRKYSCSHCSEEKSAGNIKKHEESCYLNPHNLRRCEVCNSPIKDYKHSKGTCSRSCANTLFKSGEKNGNWKQDAYQSTCFLHHGKKCIICEESLIVDAHHLDEDKTNNDPANLIPLCPNHHRYWHSRYRHLIEEKVYSYIENWKKLRLA